MASIRKVAMALALLLSMGFPLPAQQKEAYFIDGYHGGVYGHYPETFTDFIVKSLGRNPQWKICLEIEPETWDVASIYEPSAYAAFRRYLLTTDRIEYTNPSYAQSYLYNIGGESIIRQFKYGMRKLESHFPGITFQTYSTEEPCFTSALPTILSSYGFKYASTKNPNTTFGGYFSAYGCQDFLKWVGPDGESSLVTAPRYGVEALDTTCLWRTIGYAPMRKFVDAAFNSGVKHPVSMCFQDAGWQFGPWLNVPEFANDKMKFLPATQMTWKDYFTKFSNEVASADNHQFSQEDVHPGLTWGAQVLQRLAQQVRQSENKILQAEKLSSMSSILKGTAYPKTNLDQGWMDLLHAQHHDCWIVPYNIYKDSLTWAQHVKIWTDNSNRYSDYLVSEAVSAISGQGNNILAFNTAGHPRKAMVSVNLVEAFKCGSVIVDSKGNRVPFQLENGGKTLSFIADMPSYGYSSYSIVQKRAKKMEDISAPRMMNGLYIIENEYYKVTIDPAKGGSIASIKQKKHNGEEIVSKSSEGSFNGLKGFFPEEGKFHSSTEAPAEVYILSSGPIRSSLKIVGSIAGQKFVQVVSLIKDSPVIDCSLEIDWKDAPAIGQYVDKKYDIQSRKKAYYDSRYLLHLTFPSTADGGQLYKNAPFDVCKSGLKDTFFDSFDSLKHNVILNWIDLDNGNGSSLALFSDHTTSYLYGEKYPLGLTVQYIGKGMWGRENSVSGPTEIHYALVPHSGSWDEANISQLSDDWNEGALAGINSNLKDGQSLISISSENYQLSSVYFEDGLLYVRLYNESGSNAPVRVNTSFGFTKAEVVELNGKVISTLPGGHSFEVQMPRFAFSTIRCTILK